MRAEIFNLAKTPETVLYRLCSLGGLEEMGRAVVPGYYEKVWSGWLTIGPRGQAPEQILEDILRASREGILKHIRPVLVSDVILLDGTAWYCDSIGWEKIEWPGPGGDTDGD